jgi:NTE family protein
VPVAEAVRMSMSIPLFFAAVMFNGEVHVDGGAVWNYPIEIFDGDEPSPATLGFRLENLTAPPPPPRCTSTTWRSTARDCGRRS